MLLPQTGKSIQSLGHVPAKHTTNEQGSLSQTGQLLASPSSHILLPQIDVELDSHSVNTLKVFTPHFPVVSLHLLVHDSLA